MTQVETKKAQRRKLRFQSIDDALAEIDRIEQADRDGCLQCMGNWTPGQVFSHLAAWIEYGYDGYPLKSPPWILRFILRLFVPKMLRDGMSPGVRIPGIPEGTIGMEPALTSDAAERLRKAFQRLKRGDPAPYDSPAFGKMSHEDRIRLNLRHAELHMSFLDYPSS
jgi:hypothetical protein